MAAGTSPNRNADSTRPAATLRTAALHHPPRQLTELIELADTSHQEAERCRDAGRGPAALILLGGTAEATLLATVCMFEPELRQAGLWARKDDPTKWTLGKLASTARQAGWLPTQPADATGTPAGKQSEAGDAEDDLFATLDGQIGDAMRFVERLRNMPVHPGAYALDQAADAFDRAARPAYGRIPAPPRPGTSSGMPPG